MNLEQMLNNFKASEKMMSNIAKWLEMEVHLFLLSLYYIIFNLLFSC